MPATEQLLRNRNRLDDWGGEPDNPAVDNTPAMWAAIAWACSTAGSRSVEVPGGVWWFDQHNPLHPVAAGAAAQFGIRFYGDSQNWSILRMKRSAGSPRWFYDSLDSPGWNRWQLEDLWFDSDAVDDPTQLADVNGFRLWARESPFASPAGHDKGLVIRNVRHNLLGTPLQFSGTANTDSFNSYSCWWQNCGRIVVENDQALLLNFYSPHFWNHDGALVVKATAGMGQQAKGGGGAINFYDADLINNARLGDAGAKWMFEIEDGAAFYRHLNFRGCRTELRNPESRFLKWRGTASFLTGSRVYLDGCDLSVAQQGNPAWGGGGSDPNGRRDIFWLGPHKRLVCVETDLPDQLGILFDDVNTASVVGFGHQPFVEFHRCGLPMEFISGTNDAGSAADATRGLTGRVTLSNGYGRVRARDCYQRDADPVERYCYDFDYGGDNAVRGEPSRQRFQFALKTAAQTWPLGDGTAERTGLLPENTRILGIEFFEPASGASSTPKQVRVGPNDKSAVWAESASDRSDAVHRDQRDLVSHPAIFPIDVGSNLNLRRPRCWATAGTLAKSGGYLRLICE